VVLDGKAYPLNTDFRVGIAFYQRLISGEPISLAELYGLWYPEAFPDESETAQEAIYSFFRCGREKAKTDEHPAIAYAFGADGSAIIAAFAREYHIDLTQERMHWWRFSALLEGLYAHSFSERVQYRQCNPAEIKNKELRAKYQRLKQTYALDGHGQPIRQPQTLEEYNEMLLRRARGEG
jgi:hypothetical protein